MKSILPIVISAFISTSALAENYQAEVSINASRVEANNGFSSDGRFLSGRFFFTEVDTQANPLAESAFLNQSSSIGLSFGLVDDNYYESSSKTISANFYIPRTILYVGGSYSEIKSEFSSEFIRDSKKSSHTIVAGIAPINGLLLTTSYTKDVDYETNISAKYVHQLSDDRAINVEASYIGQEKDIFSIGTDYYFTRSTSLGFGITDFDFEQRMEIRGKHFFTENFFSGLTYAEIDSIETYSLTAGLRF